MSRRSRLASSALPVSVVLSLILAPPSALASVVHEFTEDFSTTTYRDGAATTAWWNTGAGQIQLYDFTPSSLGSYDTAGNARRCILEGDVLYVADYDGGLLVVDLQNPALPIPITSLALSGYTNNLWADGNHLYVTAGSGGLHVVDITNPSAPSLITTYATPSNAYAVEVHGDLAYLAVYSSGFLVLDVSNPAAPTPVGSVAMTYSYDLEIAGDLAYVGGRHNFIYGVHIFDISDPTNPTDISVGAVGGNIFSLELEGNRIWAASLGRGLYCFDVSNPASLVKLNTYDTPGSCYDVDVVGQHAYLADAATGLMILDVADPSAPVLRHTFDTPDFAQDVLVDGEYAVVCDRATGLLTYHVAEPHLPTTVARTPGGSYGPRGMVFVEGDYLYAQGLASEDLMVFDVSDPLSPAWVTTLLLPGEVQHLALEGRLAYVAAGEEGLHVVDLDPPGTATYLATFPVGVDEVAYAVGVSGDRAYLGVDRLGPEAIMVLDVSDPTSPVTMGTCLTLGHPRDLVVAGDVVYVGTTTDLRAYDVSDPANPTEVGFASLLNINDAHLILAGDLMYTAGDDFFYVHDVTDPTTPVQLFGEPRPYAYDVVVSGHHAYLADSYGLRSYDISDPGLPVLQPKGDTEYSIHGLAVEGDHAFCAMHDDLNVMSVLDRRFDAASNVAQSTYMVVTEAGQPIDRVRLEYDGGGAIRWEVNFIGSTGWQEIVPGAEAADILGGDEMRWRATLFPTGGEISPAADEMRLWWYFDEAILDGVLDVPDDQGGWVRTVFTRSSKDFADESYQPILDYYVWQRVDDPLVAQQVAGSGVVVDETLRASSDLPAGGPLVEWEGRWFKPNVANKAGDPFPPGTWEVVASAPAIQQDQYVVRVPTTADFSPADPAWSVYVVSAHVEEPTTWYVSFPDSGSSVDNIAPGVPTGMAAHYGEYSNDLSWDVSGDKDFQFFRVYRGSTPEFVPNSANVVHETADTAWTDWFTAGGGRDVYYKMTALDHVENESDVASPETVTSLPTPDSPARLALEQNRPNPFNPSTTLAFTLRADSHARLSVYTAQGRLVRVLVDEVRIAGRHQVTWDGHDTRGAPLPSGNYYCRLEAEGEILTRTLTLLK